MGRDVPAIVVSHADRRRYREKVRGCLDVFARMLRESKFASEPQQAGLEIEFNLVDSAGLPSMRGAEVLAKIADAHWSPEVGRFNVEVNLAPRPLLAGMLGELEQQLACAMKHGDQAARQVGARLMMIGVLPTLSEADAIASAMSPTTRFRLLNQQICAARGEEVKLCIEGADRLVAHLDTIIAEAACTSVQCHLQVSPEQFHEYWNAANAIAGIQVALGANSPFVYGRQLWHETRITLFQQAIDTRPEELQAQGVRPRAWFGEGWITSVFDLFEENLRYFPALLPLCADEDPLADLENGRTPELAELTLHNGTVYRWNRPVYAVKDGEPHLRVENRVLPAGPTVVDVLANAAFYYGLIHRLSEAERPVWTQMSFEAAKDNLIEGARHGIHACLYWPGLGEVPVTELTLRRLLPLAREGLQAWDVDDQQAERLLGVIEQRCLTGQNGATWQTGMVRMLEERGGLSRPEALREMTQRYLEFMYAGEPVHCWPVI
jgi:hypothetical protein